MLFDEKENGGMHMKEKSTLFTMTSCALMAALMCALCPVSIPIGPIPVSLGTFVMMLTVYLLGTKKALISCAVYLLLGAVGMPVFSGFQGGLAKLAGPTGGYLIGYLGLIAAAGVVIHLGKGRFLAALAGMALGIAVVYAFGTAWFVVQTGSTVSHALAVCVYPFIPVDAAKAVAAAFLGKLVRPALIKAKLL